MSKDWLPFESRTSIAISMKKFPSCQITATADDCFIRRQYRVSRRIEPPITWLVGYQMCLEAASCLVCGREIAKLRDLMQWCSNPRQTARFHPILKLCRRPTPQESSCMNHPGGLPFPSPSAQVVSILLRREILGGPCRLVVGESVCDCRPPLPEGKW